MTFEKVEYYYSHKLWTIARVRDAVVKGVITTAQFEEITGEAY